MSPRDPLILSTLYDGLASPQTSPAKLTTPRRLPLASLSSSPLPPTPTANTANVLPSFDQTLQQEYTIDAAGNDPDRDIPHDLPLGSLLPNRHPQSVYPLHPTLHAHLAVTKIDSLTREKKGKMPALSHLLSVGKGRVLSLAADDKYVYAGCQSADNEIVVFSRNSLQPMYRLLGHQGSVLSLLVVEEKEWLVSSSSAGDIRIWSTQTLQPVYIIHPCDDTAGDIYSLAWDNRAGGTLYLGTQGATIEWVNFAEPHPSRRSSRTRVPSLPTASASKTLSLGSNGERSPPISETAEPKRPSLRTGRYRPHSFFDNPPSDLGSGSSTPRGGMWSSQNSNDKQCFSASDIAKLRALKAGGRASPSPSPIPDNEVLELEIGAESRLAFAHYGYVYALQIVHRPDGTRWLVSGSGDCDVKVWLAHEQGGLQLINNFTGLQGAVHSFAVRDSLLYAGQQDGEIKTWDLETGACIRSIQAHDADVLTMSVLGDDVYTAAADGRVLRLDEHFDCTAAWRAHSGIILSSTIVKAQDRWELITAGNDLYVKIWTIDMPRIRAKEELDVEGEGDVMLYALSKLVAVPTVSDDVHRESCRQGAHLLKKILQQLGAVSEVISGEEGRNPLVLATFSGKDIGKPRKRLLFYGHYDVQPAQESYWETDPWTLSGRNGYLYGRGVSDNKGPILAVACAAAALRQRRELDVDLVMLVEGEEEAGSRGFASTVRKHKDTIGHIDAVLLSNSTWIDEADPCVVFGMRGVVYAHLSISSEGDDAHSGVDGGAVEEPMFDMVRVLGAIADRQAVKVPGFYDDVRPKTEEEMSILREVSEACSRPVEDLVKVWREPSFSIANITSTGATNKTVIPRKVAADISIRIVPDQDLKSITQSLIKYCQNTFGQLGSGNKFEINITHSASWWLTSLDSPYFCALKAAVEDVWGVKPLKIREGGTVPTIFWLEQEFQAPCVHLPLGQASDAGHLANERMRLLNLRNGKRVVESYLTRLANI